jgi:hypothetical protein
MLTCSHTHAGPATPCLQSLGVPDAGYLAELRSKLVGVAVSAWEKRAPARAGAARAPVAIALNRRDARVTDQDGVTDVGTVQPHVEVLRVDDESGKPMAVWMCHPAHPVTLRHDNLLFSADWVGYARQAVERRHPGTVALFAQGCAGNLVSWPHDGAFETAKRQGETFGEAVCSALESAGMSAAAEVACLSEDLRLPLLDPPSPEEARATLAQCRRTRDDRWEQENYGWRMLLDGDVAWAERVVALAESGATGLTVGYEVQATRVGDFAAVGLDGEVFVEYALNIARESPFPLTAVAAYSNGNVGYVPTAAAHERGGYEVDTAIRYYGTLRLAPECEGLILESASKLLNRLYNTPCLFCGSVLVSQVVANLV